MATEKDLALVDFLVNNTRDQKIKWEATAVEDQFATTFKGKYVVLIDKGAHARGEQKYWLTLKDTNDREMLKIMDLELPAVAALYHMAERASLNVDAAIDEILDSDDDIPF